MKLVQYDVKVSVTDPQTGKKVQRVGHAKIRKPETVDEILEVLGTWERALGFLWLGMKTKLSTDIRNELGKADQFSKAINGIWKQLQKIQPDITEDQVRELLIANPALAGQFEAPSEIPSEVEFDFSDKVLELPGPRGRRRSEDDSEDEDEESEDEE